MVKEKENENRYRKMQERLLIFFCAIVCLVTGFLSTVILFHSSVAIRDNASMLIDADTRQLQLNINSYLDKVKTTAALLFSDEDYYKYDATNEGIGDYQKLQYEDGIMNRIVDLGIMENFSDFGIIYANNYTVGWISNTTKGLFESGTMYDSFVPYITNEKTSDGWFFGINDNYDRLYYIKRLNDNAILLASIYNRELASVFELPQELDGMILRLINEDSLIIYSSDKNEIGEILPDGVSRIVGDSSSLSYTGKDSIITVSLCENDWRVVCVVPESIILAEIDKLTVFTISFSLVLAAVFVLIGLYAFGKISKPMDTVVSGLEQQAIHDGLSGLINKVSFESIVADELGKISDGRTVVMAIMDVDHFKSVNDTLGHEYGDQVIVRTSDILKRVVASEATIGRIGGDEFAFFATSHIYDAQHIKPGVEKILKNVSKEFLEEFAHENETLDLSVSIGVLIISYDGQEFSELYKMADAALYVSKEKGRNRYTFYEEGMINE